MTEEKLACTRSPIGCASAGSVCQPKRRSMRRDERGGQRALARGVAVFLVARETGQRLGDRRCHAEIHVGDPGGQHVVGELVPLVGAARPQGRDVEVGRSGGHAAGSPVGCVGIPPDRGKGDATGARRSPEGDPRESGQLAHDGRAILADQHLATHGQPSVRFEPSEPRLYLFAHGTPVCVGQRRIDFRAAPGRPATTTGKGGSVVQAGSARLRPFPGRCLRQSPTPRSRRRPSLLWLARLVGNMIRRRLSRTSMQRERGGPCGPPLRFVAQDFGSEVHVAHAAHAAATRRHRRRPSSPASRRPSPRWSPAGRRPRPHPAAPSARPWSGR